jgi:hypothetical protein
MQFYTHRRGFCGLKGGQISTVNKCKFVVEKMAIKSIHGLLP